MTRRAFLLPIVLGASLWAGSAIAERGPECGWDEDAQRFVEGGLPAWVEGGGAPDFAATFVSGERRQWRILHHCPTGTYLLIAARDAVADTVWARFTDMVYGAEKFTLDRIGTALGERGAEVRRGRGDIGTCDCDWLATLDPLE